MYFVEKNVFVYEHYQASKFALIEKYSFFYFFLFDAFLWKAYLIFFFLCLSLSLSANLLIKIVQSKCVRRIKNNTIYRVESGNIIICDKRKVVSSIELDTVRRPSRKGRVTLVNHTWLGTNRVNSWCKTAGEQAEGLSAFGRQAGIAESNTISLRAFGTWRVRAVIWDRLNALPSRSTIIDCATPD